MNDTGSLEFPQRVYETYREAFVSHIDKSIFLNSKFKAVIDYGFGGASEILPGILGSLGIDSVSLNSFIDPRQAYYFTSRQREATKQLGTIVKSLGADIGILLNSGAEKIVAVGEKGGVISPQKMLLKVADNYDEEVDATVAAMVSVIEPIMVVVLGVIVGFIVVSIFLPLPAMISAAGSKTGG